MFKILSAIFTAGVIVGVSLMQRGRNESDKTGRRVAPLNESTRGRPTEPQVPVASTSGTAR